MDCRRECSSCGSSHRDIYYKRLTDVTTFTPWSYITDDWISNNNLLNIDFKLYSSLQNALDDTNGWTYCNYANNVGFPRDCGPNGFVGSEWNTFYSDLQRNILLLFCFNLSF